MLDATTRKCLTITTIKSIVTAYYAYYSHFTSATIAATTTTTTNLSSSGVPGLKMGVWGGKGQYEAAYCTDLLVLTTWTALSVVLMSSSGWTGDIL